LRFLQGKCILVLDGEKGTCELIKISNLFKTLVVQIENIVELWGAIVLFEVRAT